MKKHTLDERNKLYTQSDSADKGIFAEMRTNCLMVSGDHYRAVQEKLLERLRDSKIAEQSKLKLVKNHIQVIIKTYVNNIVSMAPGVQATPFNEAELADQKDSELSQAVWSAAEEGQCVDELVDKWANHFLTIAEVCAKVYWDPNKGKLIGYKQKVDEEGNPLYQHPAGVEVPAPTSEMGAPLEPVADKTQPQFEGDLVIKPILGFNLLRDPSAETIKDSPWLCEREMLTIEEAKALINASELSDEEKEDKIAKLSDGGPSSFKVFDGSRGEYVENKDRVLIKSWFFRPCSQYPEGYFFIDTEIAELFSGPLPFGIFPIVHEGFDEIPTSARYRSLIKALRPGQATINMLSSKKSQHALTVGDDKVILHQGSKLQRGSTYSGIKEFSVNGPPPTIIPGRAGDQFAASIMDEVKELYQLANLEYEMQEKSMQDPYAMLYSSLRQRKKYAMYVKKFERFLCNVAKLYLRLAKRYFSEDRIIRAVGRREAINIAEFKRIEDDGFNIKLKPVSQDADSLIGKSMQVQQVLQYIGKDLPKHVQGLMIKQMPFINDETSIKYLTVELDNIESDILALDRGEYRPAEPEDDHELHIQMLTSRKKQGDFMTLPPQIKQMYETKLQEHRQLKAQQLQELKAQQSEFIPTGGALITCSVHVPDPGKPGGTRQLRLPYESLMHLAKLLEAQGQSQESLEQMDQYNQVQILSQISQQNGMGEAAGMQPPQPFAS